MTEKTNIDHEERWTPLDEIKKGKLLTEWCDKKIYLTNNPDVLLTHYSNDIIDSKGELIAKIKGKGEAIVAMNTVLLKYLKGHNVPTYFKEDFKKNEFLISQYDAIPLRFRIYNYPTDVISKKIGVDKDTVLPLPIIEIYFITKDAKESMINESTIRSLKLVRDEQLKQMIRYTKKINVVFRDFFERRRIVPACIQVEFGISEGKVLVVNEFKPDNMAFWEITDNKKFNEALFKWEKKNYFAVYDQLLQRIIQ